MTNLEGKPSNLIAIILPAFNEQLTVAATIQAFHQQIPTAEIVVVDNSSSDATAEIARQTLSALGANGQVISELRQGKAYAVRRAFLDVNADYYVIADADMTYPANQLSSLLDPIVSGHADMAVGDRRSNGNYTAENKRPLHDFGNRLVCNLVNYLFGANLIDIMSGYRVFTRCFVKNYPVLVEGFELETDMTLYALDKRFRILEVPITYKDRPEGSSSKLNTLQDGTRVLITIAQVLRQYRPLIFFSTISLVFGLAGLVAALPVFSDWIQFRYIYHLPLAVLAAALELAAMISLGVGLTLDSIRYQQRMAFEQSLLQQSLQAPPRD